MRAAIATSISALAHVGLIGTLAVWIIPIAKWHVEYEVARGDSVVQLTVPPAMDVPVKMEVTPTEQPVHEPPPAPSSFALRIGRGKFAPKRGFHGVIDEVAIFASALSPDEMREVYALEFTGEPLVP